MADNLLKADFGRGIPGRAPQVRSHIKVGATPTVARVYVTVPDQGGAMRPGGKETRSGKGGSKAFVQVVDIESATYRHRHLPRSQDNWKFEIWKIHPIWYRRVSYPVIRYNGDSRPESIIVAGRVYLSS